MQVDTASSIPQTSPAQPAVAPSNYVAAPAPAPQAPQAPTYYQQQAPAAPTSYQSAPSPSVPQSQPETVGNPWESAFNKVVGLLSQPAPFQSPAAPSAPTPQAAPQGIPAGYPSPNSAPATPSAAPLTWSPNQESSLSYSQTSSATSQAAPVSDADLDTQIADYYNLSDATRYVMNHYGTEAPAILNEYALNLETMLDSAVAWGEKAQETIAGYADFAVNEHNENLAYNEILTNPDVLSDYTLKFFGPEGPYPVYESEQELETPGYPTAPAAGYDPNAMAQLNFPAPPQAAPPQAPSDFWGQFSNQMQQDPTQAWRVLNQAQPQSMAQKLFVME
jgi:hypothetical protein